MPWPYLWWGCVLAPMPSSPWRCNAACLHAKHNFKWSVWPWRPRHSCGRHRLLKKPGLADSFGGSSFWPGRPTIHAYVFTHPNKTNKKRIKCNLSTNLTQTIRSICVPFQLFSLRILTHPSSSMSLQYIRNICMYVCIYTIYTWLEHTHIGQDSSTTLVASPLLKISRCARTVSLDGSAGKTLIRRHLSVSQHTHTHTHTQ